MIGINQDNRADGSGKAGLTFQAIETYSDRKTVSCLDNKIITWEFAWGCIDGGWDNHGWRDTLLRKNLNNKSGIIWNAIQSTDFKNNITPVLKETNNNERRKASGNDGSYIKASTTADKLWILSPSEMGMPIIKNYESIRVYYSNIISRRDANVHYYNSGAYRNTTKSTDDGDMGGWDALYNYLYAGDAYQWWMLPAGSRKMSNGNQAYHNTDSYSYCTIMTQNNPSTNTICSNKQEYYLLRSPNGSDISGFNLRSGLLDMVAYYTFTVLAFSF